MSKQGVLFDKRFLGAFAGHRILSSPRTAIVELIANSWDAGATRVDISWPQKDAGKAFAIKDNGSGMTETEFRHRWRTLSYNRLREQGPTVRVHARKKLPLRRVFGRNGVGRFAAFCFADEYYIETWRDNMVNLFHVARGNKNPLNIVHQKSYKKQGTGTRIYVEQEQPVNVSAKDIRSEIGLRFLTDPNFNVYVNGQQVAFSDIHKGQIEEKGLEVENVGSVRVIAIDTQNTDRTTQQHGVAWHVNGRLVGDCSWKGGGREDLIDGRRIAAKRYTFIVHADCLSDTESVNKDWSGFDGENESYQAVVAKVHDHIRKFFIVASEEDRKITLDKARGANQSTLERLSPREADKWEKFIETTQVTCPSIKESDLVELSKVLANLEEAQSKYALISKLSELESDQLDDLHKILANWTLDMAKAVLDEIQMRLCLLDEMKRKVEDDSTDEVQELQPLFKQGLWIFGPEFETIEYTSNEGMTTVIQRLFKPKENTKGTRNRPDFVVVPDGTVGFYSYPKYDDDNTGEIGVDRLVIIELKKPSVKISTDEKNQCWKYVKELISEGHLQDYSRVMCYPLGRTVDPVEAAPREENNGHVKIQPLSYNTVVKRAESRMLNLYKRVRNAPFLDKAELNIFPKKGVRTKRDRQKTMFKKGA